MDESNVCQYLLPRNIRFRARCCYCGNSLGDDFLRVPKYERICHDCSKERGLGYYAKKALNQANNDTVTVSPVR